MCSQGNDKVYIGLCTYSDDFLGVCHNHKARSSLHEFALEFSKERTRAKSPALLEEFPAVST